MIMNPDKQKPKKKKEEFKPGSPKFTDSPGFGRDMPEVEVVKRSQANTMDEDEELFGNLKPSVKIDSDSIFKQNKASAALLSFNPNESVGDLENRQSF